MKLQSRDRQKRTRKAKASQDHRLISRAAKLFGISQYDVGHEHKRITKAIHRSKLTPVQWLSVVTLEGELSVDWFVLQQLVKRINEDS